MKKYIILVLVIFFVSLNVYAKDDIYIDKVEVIDSSEDVFVKDKNNVDLVFNNVGESARIKLTIVNNSNKNYFIESKVKLDNVVIYFNNTKIKYHKENIIYADVNYNSLVNLRTNYNLDKIVKIKLYRDNVYSIIFKIILIIVLFIAILFVCSLISKVNSIKILNYVIIGVLFIPLVSLAYNDYLKLDVKIKINYNTLLESCSINKTNCLDWNRYPKSNNISLISIKDKEFSNEFTYGDKTYYLDSKYDVGNLQLGQVILGIYKNNNDLLYVLGGTNGVVLPEDSSFLFQKTSFNNYDLSGLNSNNVKSMKAMFYSIKTKSLDLSSFDTSNVSDMSHLFHNSYINELNISNLSIDKVNNFNYMFYGSRIINLIGYNDIDFNNLGDNLLDNSRIDHIY